MLKVTIINSVPFPGYNSITMAADISEKKIGKIRDLVARLQAVVIHFCCALIVMGWCREKISEKK